MSNDEYVNAIKQALVQAGKKLVLNWLIARFPFFSLSFVNPITAMVIGKILEILFTQTEFGLYMIHVNLKTSKQGRDFEASALANYKARQTGTKDEVEKAEKELIDRFRIFVKFHTP